MSEQLCDKCGSILLLGKEKLNIPWCPSCEGKRLESVKESKARLVAQIKSSLKSIEETVKKYTMESLLISAYVTRESDLHSKVPDLWSFIGISDLLNYILSSNTKGEVTAKWNDREIQELFAHAVSLNKSVKFISLLTNGWIRFIRIKKRELKDYSYDLARSLYVDEKELGTDDPDEEISLLKFTARWKEIADNLNANGLLSRNDAHFGQFNPTRVPTLDNFWVSIQTKIAFEQSTGNRRLLEFPHLKTSLQDISLMERFTEDIQNYVVEDRNSNGRVTSFVLLPVNPAVLARDLSLQKVDPYLFRRYVTIPSSKVNSGFPIFLMTSKGIFIGKKTLQIVSRFLRARYFREFIDENRKIGADFEELVVTELEKYKFSIRQPNDTEVKLVNVVDNEKNPTLEIDVIAYDSHQIYVIECKHVVLSTDFITRSRENTVKSVLSDEPDKMRRRVEFVRKNGQKLGFSDDLLLHIEPIFVTFNVEPLEFFEGMRIMSFRKLGELRESPFSKEKRPFNVSELLANPQFIQLAMSKDILEDDEYACMICGDSESRQLLVNGFPAQLCSDCIEIQQEMYGSVMKEL